MSNEQVPTGALGCGDSRRNHHVTKPAMLCSRVQSSELRSIPLKLIGSSVKASGPVTAVLKCSRLSFKAKSKLAGDTPCQPTPYVAQPQDETYITTPAGTCFSGSDTV
jgi:hypothetical protein